MKAYNKTKLKIGEITDIKFLNNLFQQFYSVCKVPVGLLEPDGNILVQVGWQKICMEFHRKGEFSCKNCIESDTHISERLHENPPITYKCKNGLNDVAMPVMIEGQHLATLFFGQFFYDNDNQDEQFFIKQAKLNGFNINQYLDELKKVPVYSKKEVDNILAFYMSMLKILTELGHKNLMLGNEKFLLEDLVSKRTFELKEKNEEYLTINEELKEKNDEYQSLYEEYLAQNEELQEQNEEFQALNEELEERNEEYEKIHANLKKLNKKLTESETEFRSVFENSPLGKSMTGIDGSLRVNKAFCDILGYSEQELQNKNWKEFTHPDDIKVSEDIVKSMLDGEFESFHYEKRYIHKKGQIVIADVNTNLLKDTNNNPKYFITTISDITGRKNVQAKLEEAFKELERSNKELEQFAYIASHDLQEPLRKVKNFAELFAKKYSGALDEKADQYISYMTSGADRMQSLILDLLNFSRVATRGKEFVITDMSEIVKQAIENLQYSIEENHAQIRYQKLPVIKADDSQMMQVFQNLISNAIKFKSNNDPIININAVDKKDQWLFSVNDNGIGFEMQYADRIFEVFQRLHTKEEYKGTGIGLAICKKIIERRKGKIWAESEIGKGTTFYIEIPKIK